jgi:hypothetical protein
MAVVVDLPADLEQRLRAQTPDLDAEAKEALLVELYRQDKLSHYELSFALGLDRFETDGVLNKHNVTEDLPSADDIEAELQYLRQMVGR